MEYDSVERFICLSVFGAVLCGMGVIRSAVSSWSPYKVSEPAPPVTGVDYSAADTTLLLFLSNRCHLCDESVPFYRQLVAQRTSRRSGIQIVAVGHDDQQGIERYCRDHQLSVYRAVSIDASTWAEIRGTPALVAINRQGLIMGSWLGRLSEINQSRVRRVAGF
jgi:hypothetical protein